MEKRFLALASGLRRQQEQEQREEQAGVEEGGGSGGSEKGGGGGSERGGGAGVEDAQDQIRGVDELKERFRRVFEGRYVAGESTMAVMGEGENDVDGGDIVEGGDEPDISVCIYMLPSVNFLHYAKNMPL